MPAAATRTPRTTRPAQFLARSGQAPAPARDRWIRGAGTPYPVLDLLVADGWTIVLDDVADIHCSSPDGRVYLGYLAENPRPHPGDLWHLSVEGCGPQPGWDQTFHRDTPAEVIAGLVHALLTTPPRTDEHF